MKFYIYNLGCKVNSYEMNVMRENLLNNGYVAGDKDNSDIYIVNTCTVTNTSDNKSLKLVRKLLRNYPNRIIAVVGCMTQVSPNLLDELDVSIVLGNSGKSKIAEYINKYIKTHKKIIDIKNIDQEKMENMCLTNFNRTRSFVKIEDGCENFCSYCIIPYARGKVRSKDPDLVIKEVTNLIKKGHHEIVLTGIHTGHYGSDINFSFANLLKRLVALEGLDRLRISSIEITELTDEVLEVIKSSSNLVPHLHIPLQSGSNKILKLMNRKYDKEYFINKIKYLKNIKPGISITTDVIVGFPGEDEELFNETINTINKIGFSKIHVFPFSLRKGTKACELPNPVDDETKKKRVKILLNISKILEIEYMNKYIDKTVMLLPEIYNNEFLIGHTDNYLKVRVKGDKNLINNFIEVRIVKNNYPYLDGIINN